MKKFTHLITVVGNLRLAYNLLKEFMFAVCCSGLTEGIPAFDYDYGIRVSLISLHMNIVI